MQTQPAQSNATDVDWRISIASLRADADFSLFPGMHRQQVLLEGGGFKLCGDNMEFGLSELYGQHAFSGELALYCKLLDGPCEVLNVMTSEHWQADIQIAYTSQTIALEGTQHVLIAVKGAHHVELSSGYAASLQEGDYLSIGQGEHGLQHQAGQDGVLVLVSFKHKG